MPTRSIGIFTAGAVIASAETFPTQVTGSNGECVGIPTNATAVAMNTTIINPTAASFLTLFPSDVLTPPKASSLNWVAGQAPTPNKATSGSAPTARSRSSTSPEP